MGRGEKVTLDGFAGTPAEAPQEAPQEEARPKRKRVRAQEAPQEPEPVQEPAEALPGPAPAPSEEVTVEFDDEPSVTYVPTPTVTTAFDPGVLKRMVSMPRGKTQTPTLIRFRPDGDVRVRFILVDLGESVVRDAWAYYRSAVPNATPERFLRELNSVMHLKPPRMFKVVADLSLLDENL